MIAKPASEMTPRERCLYVDERTPPGGLYTDAQRSVFPGANSSWQVGPNAWPLPPAVLRRLEAMGGHLLAFYRAANLLYSQSWRGLQPRWIAEFLERGKPEQVVALGRMNRFKQHLPGVIRPDVIPTRNGLIATELDSVPGGIGFTGSLGERYGSLGDPIVGGADGMMTGFGSMIRSTAEKEDPVLAVVISEESASWRPEMAWTADRQNAHGLETYVVATDELTFREDGLYVSGERGVRRVDVLYRFFELFDLKNIPKMDLILYAARKDLVRITPPPKTYLEEKMLMAFFHHPHLQGFWLQHLGRETVDFLFETFPRTWVLDPSPLPPQAVIAGLEVGGRAVSDFGDLARLSQKERELVIKPSGFSELAWGSRGVSIGHDLSEEDWAGVVRAALDAFPHSPHILQVFHNGSTFTVKHYDFARDAMAEFKGRVRLQPYYFVIGEEPVLSGIQATVCPADKKVLHGMVDAVVLPCGPAPSGAARS